MAEKFIRGDTLPIEIDLSAFTESLNGVRIWLTVKKSPDDADNQALFSDNKVLTGNTNPTFVFGPGGVGSTDNVPLDTDLYGDVQLRWPSTGYIETWKGIKLKASADITRSIS